jgi:hypothetical protein
MSVESHINQLEIRHQSLKTRLNEISASPSIDQSEIAELKRQKLWLKDEISRLQTDGSMH